MTKAKRTLALLTAMLTAAALVSCGGNKTGSSTPAGTSDPATSTGSTDSGKVVPIKWLTTGDTAAEVIESGDRIVAAINEKLGIDLSVTYVPEGNTEKVNVAMASGDFPDIVTGAYGTSATQGWIDNGMIIPLNDYMANLPDLNKRLSEEYSWTAQDGQFYGVPFITQYSSANALITMRQDWLDKLNLTYPTNLQEFKDVMTAFTFNDPDGDGQNNTYGYTDVKPAGNFTFVFGAYGREYADFALNDAGEVIPWFEDDCFVPGMTYIKDLWDSGVIDPEFMLNDNAKKEEKFFQGQAGAMIGALYRHVTRIESSLQQLFPEASIAYGTPPKGEDGSYGMNLQGKSGMFTAITAACENPDKAAAFIDFMLSEEGNNLVRLGIEGTHYTVASDGSIEYNEEERAKDAFSPNSWAHALAWGTFYWPLESGYLPENEPGRDRALETVELASDAQLPNLVKQKTSADIEYGSACDDVYNQYFSDILTGKYTVEEGVQKLSADWRAAGGDKILEAANEAYKANAQE